MDTVRKWRKWICFTFLKALQTSTSQYCPFYSMRISEMWKHTATYNNAYTAVRHVYRGYATFSGCGQCCPREHMAARSRTSLSDLVYREPVSGSPSVQLSTSFSTFCFISLSHLIEETFKTYHVWKPPVVECVCVCVCFIDDVTLCLLSSPAPWGIRLLGFMGFSL